MNIIINLNKDRGITSHEAVTKIKRLFKVRKAGHAGTLDPLATGVLIVCLNEATKITSYLSELDKEYLAVMKLGESTDTFDSEGKIIKSITDFTLSTIEVKRVIDMFVGDIEQTPPMFSAIKMKGEPLYKLARKGISADIKPRKVHISKIDILCLEQPFLSINVSCSKGTYIRSLCNDIGNALGVGAHLTSLTRTKIGDFKIENSAKMEELPQKIKSIYSIDNALSHLPEVKLFDEEFHRVKNGNPVRDDSVSITGTITDSKVIRLKDSEGIIFGLGKISGGWIKPQRLFNL